MKPSLGAGTPQNKKDKRLEPWQNIRFDYSQYKKSFSEANYGQFVDYEAFVKHLVKTAKLLRLIQNESKYAWPLFINSVAGMQYELGSLFGDLLTENIDYDYEEVYDIVNKTYYFFSLRHKRQKSEYYVDKEYAVICLQIQLRKTLLEKTSYLSERSAFYKAMLIEDDTLSEGAVLTINKYIDFCDLFTRFLTKFWTSIVDLTIEKSDIKHIFFVDDSILDQVYYTLLHYKVVEKGNFRYIQSKEKDRLRKFLRTGKLPKDSQIYFRGETKQLAYCFHELHKNGLLNNMDFLNSPISLHDLAEIISITFKNLNVSTRTLYDYLRKGEESMPLNPIFIIKKNPIKNVFFEYLLCKPKYRKKGEPFKPESMTPYDTAIIEEILQLDNY